MIKEGGYDDLVVQEIKAGLSLPVAEISPKYFYNDLGSQLFELITGLKEYYPTRTEREIMNLNSNDINARLAPYQFLVDLGAGNCEKAVELMKTASFESYLAVDISEEFLSRHVDILQKQNKLTEMQYLGTDFMNAFELPRVYRNRDKVFFYPGSSIGNFEPSRAQSFLKNLLDQTDDGASNALLIGVDLIKDHNILNEAYDDPLGVTAAFNLNVLDHLNDKVGTDFKIREWSHIAYFNTEHSRIEMHLEARSEQVVKMRDGPWQRSFAKGERILTEYSYKYSVENFTQMLKHVGFKSVTHWVDRNEWFGVFFATP